MLRRDRGGLVMVSRTRPSRACTTLVPSCSLMVSHFLNMDLITHMLTLCLGSVFVSGSNPNPDYVAPGPGVTYPTEYRVERFYPSYYEKRRPEPTGLPTTLAYGGNYWQANLTAQDLNNDPATYIQKTKAVVVRTGFSTHAINMSQRLVELGLSYNVHDDGSATLYISQMPPNPALFPPGPASTSSPVLATLAVAGVTDAMFVLPQCSSSQSMAYPLSRSGLPLAAERSRHRLRRTRWRCRRIASRVKLPVPTTATRTITMANRQRGQRSMRDLRPSSRGPLLLLPCFSYRRAVLARPYDLGKSRGLFSPPVPILVTSRLVCNPPLGFLRCGHFLPDIGNTITQTFTLPTRSPRADTPQLHHDPIRIT